MSIPSLSPEKQPAEKNPSVGRIRFFDDDTIASPDELGGKGYSLAMMKAAGIPVPAGFTLKASAWEQIYNSNDPAGVPADIQTEIRGAMRKLEQDSGKRRSKGWRHNKIG